MNNPRAKSLFHFTKSPEILKSILKNGIYPRFCLETNWCKYADEEYYAFSISCFCDIPLSRINEHTDSYGHYGLGLTKNWGIKNGLNPVIYFPENGSILKLAHYLLALTGANRHTLQDEEYKINISNLLKLMKPINGKVRATGVLKDFYQENEWRYSPENDIGIPESHFNAMSELENKKAEKFKLNISPNDIKYIFVKDDADIPAISDFLRTDMGFLPDADIKILQTRIISLETIRLDL